MLEKLKERVCEQNLQLVKYGLVVLTWGQRLRPLGGRKIRCHQAERRIV